MKPSATLPGWSVPAALGLQLLSPRALAYEPGTGSWVAGNLSAAAPYGIPPSEFAMVTRRVTSSATFNVTGYDVSADDAGAGTTAVPGWTLTVGVTTDVSLIDAAEPSNLDFEATTLSLDPPGGNVTLHPSWTVCAVVFPGLAGGDPAGSGAGPNASAAAVDGSCDGLLSGGCIQAIRSNPSGIGGNGTCGSYALPSACGGEFPADSANSTAIAINQSVLDEGRFYAHGSPPTQTANQTAYELAFNNVWPVITLFRHSSGNGAQASVNAAVQCVRALNGTTTPPSKPSPSGAGRYEIPSLSAIYWLSLAFSVRLVSYF